MHHYHIPEIPDYTHYKYVTAYEGSVLDHIFLRSEHLFRMIANFNPGDITIVFRFRYDPAAGTPQDRMKLSICAKVAPGFSIDLAEQVIRHGPLAEFYRILPGEDPGGSVSFEPFGAVSEIIRFEECIQPTSPAGLDIHKLIPALPKSYYCPHPFKPRGGNDFLMFDKACSSLQVPACLEIMAQPVSQVAELEALYREIVRLMAVNSYSNVAYITGEEDLPDPFKEESAFETNEIKAKEPIADEFLKSHREFHKNLRQQQLLFNVKVWAPSPIIAHLLASTVAECAFEKGSYRLLGYDADVRWFEGSKAATNRLDLFLASCCEDIWDKVENKELFRLAHMTSVDEFTGMFRLPVAGYSPPLCLWKSTDYHRKTKSKEELIVGHAATLSETRDFAKASCQALNEYLDTSDATMVPVAIDTNQLTKHMFIAGVPGAGKTTAVFNLIVQFYKQGIPFLVIEPGKTEYRQLKMLGDHPDPVIRKFSEDLRIFTPGKDEVSPFRFNPFEFPEGIGTDEHIGQLLNCFEASVPLGGPLQALLAESIEVVYQQKSVIGNSALAAFPTMTELVEAARATMKIKGYAGEVRSNLSAAIDVRLSSLTRLSMGKIFQCRESQPALKEILGHPTIIEIQNLNPYQSCLLTFFLLSAIWEEIRIGRRYSKHLQHVTIIEEAHNIVGRAGPANPSEDFADPKAYAAEHIVRMLAEVRALGEGIIIADQLPTAVSSYVVKNTGTKLAHRLVSLEDREDLGGAMLLQGPQMEEIARLRPGQAFYYTEGLYAPRQISGLNAYSFLNLESLVPPDNQSLWETVHQEVWYDNLKQRRYAYIVKLFSEKYESFQKAINRAQSDLELYEKDLIEIEKNRANYDSKELLELLKDIAQTRAQMKLGWNLFSEFVQMIPRDILESLNDDLKNEYFTLCQSSTIGAKYILPELDEKLAHLKMAVTGML